MKLLDPIEGDGSNGSKITIHSFQQMEETESLLRATPFGEKENGSNGSSLASRDWISTRELCLWSMEIRESNVVIRIEGASRTNWVD
jgi:hypothetical protein